MRKILAGLCLVMVLPMAVAGAATPEKAEPTKPAQKADAKSGQEHNFEDLLVQGKYHFSDEAVTTVEEDKVLDTLLGVRADFKDRMEKSAGQY